MLEKYEHDGWETSGAKEYPRRTSSAIAQAMIDFIVTTPINRVELDTLETCHDALFDNAHSFHYNCKSMTKTVV